MFRYPLKTRQKMATPSTAVRSAALDAKAPERVYSQQRRVALTS
jgi:hypothetical protein